MALLINIAAIAQVKDSTTKRVLENTEVDVLLSYYNQDGVHSAVNGGIGSEKLSDIASNIVVAVPLNDDDVLTFDVGISAYTSASSSNINPYDESGASGSSSPTPWQASSGASRSDQLASAECDYSHNSDNRNNIWNADVSFSNGMIIHQLVRRWFYQVIQREKYRNKRYAYLDQWRPFTY
jgi:hypothetical protein